jgi:DNA-3-methyladenine glycosylase II
VKKNTKLNRKIKIDQKGLRKLTPSKNYFGSLAQSIIHQQLSRKAALKIEQKFLKIFNSRNKFPKPEEVLKPTDAQFRSAGLSAQKTSYLYDLAKKFIDGTITPKKFLKMTDEEIIEHLTMVKGVGAWTAQMFLIFALNRKNVLPVGDLGTRKGFQKVFNLRALPSEKQMRKLAEPYEGDHTMLTLYLWQILDE